jgi:trimeric autotransporter adhesin
MTKFRPARGLAPVLLALVASCAAPAQPYTISTFAGDGLPIANIPGTYASLFLPTSVATDKTGNVFFSDAENIVLRLDSKTGALTVVAGNGTEGFSGDNGPATSAQLNTPLGVAVDSAGNLYIADAYNGRIRKVSNGVITTFVGTGLSVPSGVLVDAAGNLYIADSGNNRICKVSDGVLTTVAGNGTAGFSGDNGPATSAQLTDPRGTALDSVGNLYIADAQNNRIRKVANGVITTVAGNGTAGFTGDNGPATSAQLNGPWGVVVDTTGDLYIADADNGRVRKVANGIISTAAGGGPGGLGDNGPATSAQLSIPTSIAEDSAGNLYIADNSNSRVRKVSNGVITTVAGNGTPGFSGDNASPLFAQLNSPNGVALDTAGNLYIADAGNSRIRKVANGVISTVAGGGSGGLGDNGPATNAQMSNPYGIAVDGAGNLYIADSGNNRIREVSNGVITTVAGNGTAGFSGDNGPATAAQLDAPLGVAVDATGNLYIADYANFRVRRVSNGIITTAAGTGAAGFSGDGGSAVLAQLNSPWGITVDTVGNVYIAEDANNRIRKVTNGVIVTLAGGGTVWGDGGPGTVAELNNPKGVAVDTAGNAYIADRSDNRIRLLTPGAIPAIAQGGIVPVYSAVPVIQPGSWVSIYGSNLAAGTVSWSGNFPTSLGATSVTIDNKLAYLWFVSPTQINLQVPTDATIGLVSVVVTTAAATATSTVTLSPYSPSFSLLGDGKHVDGEILTPSGYDLVGPSNTFSYSKRPVNPGETLVLYGVGFGPTTPVVTPGQVFFGSAPTSSPVTVTIGGVSANVSYSGITEAGLYQINLTVPPNTGNGDEPVQATVSGIKTPVGPVVTVQ